MGKNSPYILRGPEKGKHQQENQKTLGVGQGDQDSACVGLAEASLVCRLMMKGFGGHIIRIAWYGRVIPDWKRREIPIC
jgi:hypothetical protein